MINSANAIYAYSSRSTACLRFMGNNIALDFFSSSWAKAHHPITMMFNLNLSLGLPNSSLVRSLDIKEHNEPLDRAILHNFSLTL